MKTKNMAGIIVTVSLIIVLGSLIMVGLVYYSENRLNYEVIDLIEERQRRPGVFMDMDGQVGVEDVYDLGYILKDSKIELHYGVQTIDIPYKSLNNAKWLAALDEIGIKVYWRVNEETGETEYRLTYWDEDIQEWSKVY